MKAVDKVIRLVKNMKHLNMHYFTMADFWARTFWKLHSAFWKLSRFPPTSDPVPEMFHMNSDSGVLRGLALFWLWWAVISWVLCCQWYAWIWLHRFI